MSGSVGRISLCYFIFLGKGKSVKGKGMGIIEAEVLGLNLGPLEWEPTCSPLRHNTASKVESLSIILWFNHVEFEP